MKSQKKTVSIKKLHVDFTLNIRRSENYDVPTIKQQIVEMGRILKPILVKEDPNNKGEYIVLSGNRRTLGGNELYDDSKIAVELKKALDNVDIIIFSEMTPQEELSLIIDHGSEKPISRTEVVEAVRRLDKSFLSEGQIIDRLYFALAKYSGNEKKLQEVPKDEPARSQMLKKWLHGTVGNYILAAFKMGEFVSDQFIKTHLAEDKMLPEGVTIEMRCSRERITQLSAAISADKKTTEGWSYDKGGANFNAMIEKFKTEDSTGKREPKVERPSIKDLNEKADSYKFKPIKAALQVAAGNLEAGVGLMEADELYYQIEMKLDVLSKHVNNIKDDKVRELVGSLLHGVAGGVEVALKPFIS